MSISDADKEAFVAAAKLKDLKVGDVFTEKHQEALDYFCGGLIQYINTLPVEQRTFENKEGKIILLDRKILGPNDEPN